MAEAASGEPAQRPLPPGLDLLWGRRERGRRGPRPGLSAEAIVEAAIRLADAVGLEAVSMARVAAELGFTTMSLYRYVESKEELLQAMFDMSALGSEHLVIEGEDWRTRLRNWALIQREMLDRHPWITQMPMAAPPVAPNSLHFVERGLAAMDDTGLPDADKIQVIGLISSYTLSEGRMAADAMRAAKAAAEKAEAGDPASGDDAPAPPQDFEALLRELVDEQAYPRLHRLAWSPPDNRPAAERERESFLFGVDTILDGVQARIDRAAGGN